MKNCRFLTPCGICEIKSMTGIPYKCDLKRIDKLEEEHMIEIKKAGNECRSLSGVDSHAEYWDNIGNADMQKGGVERSEKE